MTTYVVTGSKVFVEGQEVAVAGGHRRVNGTITAFEPGRLTVTLTERRQPKPLSPVHAAILRQEARR